MPSARAASGGCGGRCERRARRLGSREPRHRLACRWLHSHHTSRPNDSASRASATTRAASGQSRRQDVRGRDRQHDPLRRGDDLAPVARRQRLAHPRQQPPGREERVARRADREHPRAGRAGDVHAEDEDQERVDLAVEVRAQRRRRPRAPRDPAVDRVQRERDGRERHQHRDRRGLRRTSPRPAPRRRRRAWPERGSPSRPGPAGRSGSGRGRAPVPRS